MTTKEFLESYDKGIKFDENFLRNLLWGELDGDVETIDEIAGDEHRWTRDMYTVLKIEDRYFGLEWEEGLTELQENQFYCQLEEVKPIITERLVIETKWVPVEGD